MNEQHSPAPNWWLPRLLTAWNTAPQPHTVTQSSALSICNATQQPGAFKSGMQNAGFEFSVPVKDESTVYYFCGVPSHCQKGMVRDTHTLSLLSHETIGTMLTEEPYASAVWPDQRALAPLRPRLEDLYELTRTAPPSSYRAPSPTTRVTASATFSISGEPCEPARFVSQARTGRSLIEARRLLTPAGMVTPTGTRTTKL